MLAREGAIIPLSADDGNKADNPKSLTILAFSGNGEFDLIEDNGQTDFDEHKAVTKFVMTYIDNKLTFKINSAVGDTSVIPQKRNYRVVVRDVLSDGRELVFEFNNADINEVHTQTAENALRISKEDTKQAVIRIMSRWQEKTPIKNIAYKKLADIRMTSRLH